MHRPGLQSVANGLLLSVLGLSAFGITFLEADAAVGWRIGALVAVVLGAGFLIFGFGVMRRDKGSAATLPSITQ